MSQTKTLGAVFLALMVLLSGVGGLAGVVGASENAAFGGTQADSADQTNTTYVTTNSELPNVTIKFTETQTISDGGSVFYPTDKKADAVQNLSESDSGDIGVNIVDDGVWFNDTNANGDTASEDLESFEVVFNVTTDENETGINVNEAMPNGSDVLMEDPDASEQQHYRVIPASLVDVTPEVVGADAEFNESSSELEATGSDTTGQLVFHVTRNNTSYEDVPLSGLKFEVGLNTTYFSGISESTTENVDTLVLENVASEDGKKVYTWAMQNPNNDTLTYDIAVNATMESGDTNETLIHSSVQDPNGGVQTEADTAYDHAAASGVVSPDFTDITDIEWWHAVIGLGVVVALVYGLTAYQDPAMGAGGFGAYTSGPLLYVWVALVIIGFTMIGGFFLDGFTFWGDLVSDYDLPSWTPLLAGAALVLGTLGLNAKNSRYTPLRG